MRKVRNYASLNGDFVRYPENYKIIYTIDVLPAYVQHRDFYFLLRLVKYHKYIFFQHLMKFYLLALINIEHNLLILRPLVHRV